MKAAIAPAPINRLADITMEMVGRHVDIIGIVNQVGDVIAFTTKTGIPRASQRQTVTLCDQSTALYITLFDRHCSSISGVQIGTSVALLGFKVGSYGATVHASLCTFRLL